MAPKPRSKTSLTADEQKHLDNFLKRCSGNFNRLSTDMKDKCLTIKVVKMHHEEFTEGIAENKKMSLTLGRKLEAVAFVNEWYGKWSTHATLTLAAVVGASEEYNKILSTKAQEPIGVPNTIFGIAFVFLPEVKILEKVFSRLALKVLSKKHSKGDISFERTMDIFVKNKFTPAKENLGKAALQMEEHNKKIDKWAERINGGAQLLDRQSKELLDEAKGLQSAITASDDFDAASLKLVNAHNAKNEVFKELLGNVTSNLIEVTNLASFFYEYALSDTQGPWALDLSEPNRKKVIKDETTKYGLGIDSAPIPVEMKYETLSSLILYKMLKTYMENYCEVIFPEREPTSLEKMDRWTPVEGFDQSQGKMLYDRFGSNVWKSSLEYPSVNDTRDLIRHGWIRKTSQKEAIQRGFKQ